MSSVSARVQSVVQPHHSHAQTSRLRAVPVPALHHHHHHHQQQQQQQSAVGDDWRRIISRLPDTDRPASSRRVRSRSENRRQLVATYDHVYTIAVHRRLSDVYRPLLISFSLSLARSACLPKRLYICVEFEMSMSISLTLLVRLSPSLVNV